MITYFDLYYDIKVFLNFYETLLFLEGFCICLNRNLKYVLDSSGWCTKELLKNLI